jgi:hypothetical protein
VGQARGLAGVHVAQVELHGLALARGIEQAASVRGPTGQERGLAASQRPMATAVRSDHPEAGPAAVGHHVHRVALVDNPLAVRRDLGARRPLELEHVLRLETCARWPRGDLGLLARDRAASQQNYERDPGHPPSVIPHAHLLPRCRTLCRVSAGVKRDQAPNHNSRANTTTVTVTALNPGVALEERDAHAGEARLPGHLSRPRETGDRDVWTRIGTPRATTQSFGPASKRPTSGALGQRQTRATTGAATDVKHGPLAHERGHECFVVRVEDPRVSMTP